MLVERKEHFEENGEMGYIESIYKSDNVLKTTYFPSHQRLYLAFRRGEMYSYSNVDNELYEAFETADSQGVFFHKKIFRNKEYPYRKEFTLYPTEIKEINVIIENFDKNNIKDDNE
jgi:hypothetical protein